MLNIIRALTFCFSGIAASLFPTIVLGESCGEFSDADLVGSYPVGLGPGYVYGQKIPDANSTATFWQLDNKLLLTIEGGSMAGSVEMTLTRAKAAERLSYTKENFPYAKISLEDLALATDCGLGKDFPLYLGSGHFVSPDGSIIPSTMRLYVWITELPKEGPLEIMAIGTLFSDILVGQIFIN